MEQDIDYPGLEESEAVGGSAYPTGEGEEEEEIEQTVGDQDEILDI